ncbi:MAG: SprT family zinc-dependent metalloprotease [Candidatus Diapherotrites archaeon]
MNALEKEQRSILLSGKEINFSVLRSRKARRLKLQLSIEDGLEVVVPARASVPFSMVEKFLAEKQAWILKHLSRLEAVARESEASRNSLLFLGKEAPIEIIESERLTAKAAPRKGILLVKVPFGKKSLAGKAITAFYKKQAKIIISKIVSEKAALMGVSFRRISVRGQKTRWGSCSGRGTLSFNWRLVAAPRSVIEYIAVHELAHVRHRNHSKAFWAEVAKYLPGYKEQERWLRKNKHALKARTSFGQ